ncbi:hypothetical protein GCM10022221_67190 [Actinocorallia aurea]
MRDTNSCEVLPAPLADNPWAVGHLAVEGELQDGIDPAVWSSVVASEYAFDPPRPCTCGGTTYFKATVGTYKCPDCDALGRPVLAVAEAGR